MEDELDGTSKLSSLDQLEINYSDKEKHMFNS